VRATVDAALVRMGVLDPRRGSIPQGVEALDPGISVWGSYIRFDS